MKKCKNCQTECKNEVMFCPNCGETFSENNIKQRNETVEYHKETSVSEDKSSLLDTVKKHKNILIGIFCIAAIIAIIFSVYKNKKCTINLEDYYTVTFTGGNKYGNASADFDYDALREHIFEISGQRDDLTSYFDYTVADWVEDNVEATLNKETDLKNGDTVKVTFQYPKKDKVNGFKIKGNTLKEEVSGLEDYREIDTEELFSGLEVILEGNSPELQVNFENTSTDKVLSTVSYKIIEEPGTPIHYYKNGDILEVGIANGFSFEEHKCIYIGEPTITYEIKGQPEFVTTTDKINDDILANIQVQVDNFLKKECEEKSDKQDSYSPIGLKKLAISFQTNRLNSVCKGYYEVTHTDNEHNTSETIYVQIDFENLSVNGMDAEVSNLKAIFPDDFWLSSEEIVQRYEDFLIDNSGIELF